MDEEARGEAARDVAREFAPVDEARVGPLGEEQEARLDAVELRHRRERRAEAAEDEHEEDDPVHAVDADAAVVVLAREEGLVVHGEGHAASEGGVAVVEGVVDRDLALEVHGEEDGLPDRLQRHELQHLDRDARAQVEEERRRRRVVEQHGLDAERVPVAQGRRVAAAGRVGRRRLRLEPRLDRGEPRLERRLRRLATRARRRGRDVRVRADVVAAAVVDREQRRRRRRRTTMVVVVQDLMIMMMAMVLVAMDRWLRSLRMQRAARLHRGLLPNSGFGFSPLLN